ncbi:MAG: hypothetical protein JNM94_02855 [Phycisphaerae bacterium]|nr:hypothetical protein [Phycisphaerae bacterium]
MVSSVLIANALWLVVCSIYAVLWFSQAAADRRNGTGFQKPVGPDEID